MITVKEIVAQTTAPTLRVLYNDETLIEGELVKQTMKIYYKDFTYNGTKAEFVEHFDLYNDLHADGLKRQLEVFAMEYDPLHNYDGTETITYTYGEHITTDNLGNTYNTITNKVSGEDSESLVTNDATTSETDSVTNRNTSGTHTDTQTTTKGGNLGATKTQDMARDEVELRKMSIVFEYIKGFINEACFLCLGV